MPINPTIPTVGSPRGSEEVDVANALTTIVTAINKGTGPSVVASLPLAPADGEEVYLVADAVKGVVWHLKYRAASASAYKWEFVGGGDLLSTNDTTLATVAAAAYANGDGTPSATPPVAGEFIIAWGEIAYGAGAGSAHYSSIKFSAAEAVDADAAYHENTVATGYAQTRAKEIQKTVAAAQQIMVRYRSTGNPGNFLRRWMRVRPVRVG